MTPMEYPPDQRESKPAGTPQADTAAESVADMWCMCAVQARNDGDDEPHWYFEDGYWWCSVPELPDHDVSNAPPTVPGLIPCQPVFPWNPADHPELAERTLAAQVVEQELEDRRIL